MNILKNQLEQSQGLSSNLSSGELLFHHKQEKTVEREEDEEDDSVAKIVAVVYNSGFYCFQSPFSLKFDRRKGKYYIEKRSVIFSVIYALIQLVLIVMNVYMLQDEWISKLYLLDDFTRKYTAIMSWLWILSLVNFSWTLLRCQPRIQFSVNAIHETCQSLRKLGVFIPEKTQIKYPALFFVVYFFAWTIFDVITDVQNYFQSVPWDGDDKATFLAILQNMMLLIGEIGRLTTHFIDIICLTHAYTVYLIFSHFVNHLTVDREKEKEPQEKSTVKFNKVFDTLDQFCKLSDALESSIGRVISCVCLCLLPYYTIQVQNVFKNFESSFFQGLRTVLMVVTLMITLVFAAEANSKMNHVISWIQLKSADRRKSESLSEKLDMQEKIGIVMNQIQRNQIGLRAKFYTVTYGFIGSIVGLLLTYSVMITQLQSVDVSKAAPY